MTKPMEMLRLRTKRETYSSVRNTLLKVEKSRLEDSIREGFMDTVVLATRTVTSSQASSKTEDQTAKAKCSTKTP